MAGRESGRQREWQAERVAGREEGQVRLRMSDTISWSVNVVVFLPYSSESVGQLSVFYTVLSDRPV